jgi:protein-tyrosine-phosphatase
MAECLMKKKLAEQVRLLNVSPKPWLIESAGTWGMDGSDITESVKQVLIEMGIKPEHHSARTVNAKMLDDYDLILTMERGQKEALKIEFPGSAGRVYMLSEMIGERFDIRDPMGEPVEEFRQCARSIEIILTQGFDKIKKLIGEKG